MRNSTSWLELTFESGPRAGESLRVEESPFVVGRDRSAQLFLDDPSVSRMHAALIFRDNQWILQDMGGTNPPQVHGRASVTLSLQKGDRIVFGGSEVRISKLEREQSSRSSVSIPALTEDFRPRFLGGNQLWPLLSEWTDMLRRIDQVDELIERALEGFLRVIPAERGGLYRLDPARGTLETVASIGLEGENPVGTGEESFYSETMIARAIKTQSATLYSPETEVDAGNPTRTRSMIRKRIRNAICLPMISDNKVQGIVYLDQVSEERPPLMPEDLELGMLLTKWLAEAMEKAERFRELQADLVQLKQRSHPKVAMVGESKQIKEVWRRIRKVAKSGINILITGESGTGKELVARAVHSHGNRADKPYVAINCAAIPDTLMESELFGYAAKSGIHGADPEGKPGRFEMAQGGVLVLDEIGELPSTLQSKLLRVLEEGSVDRLGGRAPVAVDVQVVAMTNRDLLKEVKEGRFREDLYYRLHVFPIHLPPLRERVEDILPIARHLLASMVDAGQSVTISPRAVEQLQNNSWAGNVRELKNVLLQALVSGDGRSVNPRDLSTLKEVGTVSFQTLREVERTHIESVLAAVNGNKKKAAELLGIHRSTLYEKIAEFKLQ